MDRKMYMIGNAHLDPVWLWRWQDGYEAARATFRSVLDRMNEYPDFVFTSAAICYYEWIEHSDPAMFEEIRARVKEGRWQMVGGWWIQPDCNIPSGESFARQALIAQNYLSEKFGIMARTGYNVDSFGHSGSLPKILRLSGMNRYVFMRPGIHERTYPAWTFNWQSPEGEAVTAFRIPYEYCTWPDGIRAHIERCANEISDENGIMCFYGVGNHGGGPTKKNIDSIHEINGEGSFSLKLSSPDEYFDSVRGELPVVNGDLLHHASGCYAAHSGIKLMNRRAENALTTAEKWSVIAGMYGGRNRDEELTAAWKKLLFNQFHDILAGTSIKEAYDDAMQDLGYSLSACADITNEALQIIAGKVDVPFTEGAQPYIVFNTQAFDAVTPVAIEIADRKGAFVLEDGDGNEVPWQKQTASAAANGRAKLCFIAKVPALGWMRYTLKPVPCDDPRPIPVYKPEGIEPVLENDSVRAVFNVETGELCSVIIKSTGEELLRSDTRIECFEDKSDTWSHAKLHFTGEPEKAVLESIKVISDGAVERTVRVAQRIPSGRIVRDYTLYADLAQIFVRVRIDWNGTRKCLKFAYPMKLNYMHVRAQAPYGYADREIDGEEYPMQQWVDVTGCTTGAETLPCGLAILNDGKYAYDVHDKTLFFTALRSPYYANHEPMEVAEGSEDYPVIDHGKQEFNMVLLPHTGGRETAMLDRAASLVNAPAVILPEYAHKGELAAQGSFVNVRGNVLLDALKHAEDGSGDIILHMHETARQHTEAVLSSPIFSCAEKLVFSPGQIKVIRIDVRTGKCTDNDLLEREIVR